MPSMAASNYHAIHHRRQSSQSQTSLPDQAISSHQQVQSPNRSVVYLPSTTYTQPTPTEADATTQALPNHTDGNELLSDPHDFYRQYHDPFGDPSTGALHQAALRTARVGEESYQRRPSRSSVVSNRSQDERGPRSSRSSSSAKKLSLVMSNPDRRDRSTSGGGRSLGAKKASFRDLVARFDSSPDDVPPMPSQPGSLSNSRHNSPLVYTNPHKNSFIPRARRTTGDFNDAQQAGPVQLSHPPASAGISQQKRPLFGEVVPGVPASNSLGYGIVNARRRRGSEGSPMHSPNPMFRDSVSHEDDKNHSHVESNLSIPLPTSEQPYHRRANSDLSSASPNLAQSAHGHSLSAGSNNTTITSSNRLGSHSRQFSSSRIPVSTRRQSLTSESGRSGGSSRAPSNLDNHQPTTFNRQVTSTSSRPARNVKQSSPRRKANPPTNIQSPSRQIRSNVKPSADKSPSLRANIIVPPPKVSPQLRSSRPRLPVSSATTASSRARMAEKFQNSAKEQSEKQSSSRRSRPPELSDIDLKARRLRITQALSRSREGQDLRSNIRSDNSISDVFDSSPTATPAHGFMSEMKSPTMGVPALVVDNSQAEHDGDDDEFGTPLETSPTERLLTQNALLAMGSQRNTSDEGDSPTLGHSVGTPLSELDLAHVQQPSLQPQVETDYASAPRDLEPPRAIDEADPHPRNDHQQHHGGPSLSVLTQVTSMREQNSASPYSGNSSQSDRRSDRADQESVNLILRNTAYLDEEEAIAKGYRDFVPPVPPVPQEFEPVRENRESWTSSIAEQSDTTEGEIATGRERENQHQDTGTSQHLGGEAYHETSHFSAYSDLADESVRDTMASDAYTIVNIVLQQNSTSGIVDQQLVDEIYGRIISEEPELANIQIADPQKVERLCMQELEQQSNSFQGSETEETGYALIHQTPVSDEGLEFEDNDLRAGEAEDSDNDRPPPVLPKDDRPPPVLPKDDLPPPGFRTHRYKSSLDSAEDWADTSPSISDWMRFAATSPQSERPKESSALSRNVQQIDVDGDENGKNFQQVNLSENNDRSITPRLPSHSPPPPPGSMPSNGQASISSGTNVQTAVVEPPQVPRRLTSSAQMSIGSRPSPKIRPSLPTNISESISEDVNPEQKKLKHRRHVMKELVDTEHSYERDLRVLCDIYMQTAGAALSEEETRILFGNIETIQQFSKDFLDSLKRAVKPAYAMERSASRRALTRTPTSQTDRSSIRSDTPELSDAEKDNRTRVGEAFQASLEEMEKVYTEYIRTRHSANKKFEVLQTSPAVSEWLKECSNNSSDITNAWSLDALLVKPIQRITKYPLLLNQLLEATPTDHPDLLAIRQATLDVTEINIRINEVKKQTELVDQALNRKRKESDVRNGLTKAFGRRAEKLRQHVGISEVYEDGEYARLKMDFDNNDIHLMIVSKDCQGYIDAIRNWVLKTCEMAAAAEAWLDVGHSNHPQAESKLRQLAMAVRGINSLALPDHVEQINRKVVTPMQKCLTLLARFKSDPKGLLQKREKKLLDYAQAKNRKDRGEKMDKKMTERMEQWEAINHEAKERMRKLLAMTATLVQSCLNNLVQLHMNWFNMVQVKFATAMAIPLEGLEEVDLEKEWQVDFDFQEASALALGICNGSLLAEAMNLVSFLTPGSTLNGEDSPRQVSWNSGAKRSISMNSEGSHPVPGEFTNRYSGGRSSSANDYPGDSSSFGQNSARARATSQASSRVPPRTPDLGGRGATLGNPFANGGNFSRPGTSPGRNDDNPVFAPRVSLDDPSTSFGPLRTQSPTVRPGSASTFFSAAAGPSNSGPTATSAGGSVFSSAMPMSDSPIAERTESSRSGEEPGVLFTAASVYEFNIDRARQEAGIPYLTYVAGEIFDVIGERGELWLARNQDDPTRQVGWIWNKHFAKLAV